MLEWLLAPTKAAISHDAQNRFHDFPNTLAGYRQMEKGAPQFAADQT
jgi:hypothetical protein